MEMPKWTKLIYKKIINIFILIYNNIFKILQILINEIFRIFMTLISFLNLENI